MNYQVSKLFVHPLAQVNLHEALPAIHMSHVWALMVSRNRKCTPKTMLYSINDNIVVPHAADQDTE